MIVLKVNSRSNINKSSFIHSSLHWVNSQWTESYNILERIWRFPTLSIYAANEMGPYRPLRGYSLSLSLSYLFSKNKYTLFPGAVTTCDWDHAHQGKLMVNFSFMSLIYYAYQGIYSIIEYYRWKHIYICCLQS